MAIVLLLVNLLAAFLASSATAEIFRYSTTGDILGLDPHTNNEGTTNAMKMNIYEGLLHRAWDLSLHPALATQWQQVEPTRWRFNLRQGVKFHNGNTFDADDVLVSFDRIRSSQSDMSYAVGTVSSINKIDAYTIELVTTVPDPTLLLALPAFLIMDQQWLEQNEAMQPVRGTMAGNFANTHANGTGPFRLVERQADTRTVLEPNADWWGEPRHNITKAIFQPIANDATRVAALLTGEMDLIYPVPLQDIDRINRTDHVRTLEGPELRTIFLGFDQWRDESLDMPGSGRNPFKDVRVRRAVYHAIDEQAIARVVMRGAARPAGLMIAPGINGYPGEPMDQRLPYDPAMAKRLLAEAGYPDGFPVTFDCPTDRYVKDEAICTAIVSMLQRVGIRVIPNFQTKTLYFDKISIKGGNRTSFFLLGWTPNTFDVFNTLQNVMTMHPEGHGIFNCGRYSNPEVEQLTVQIQRETDPQKRDALVREAFRIHQEDVGHIPLHQQYLAWGMADTVAEIKQRPFNDVDLRYVVMRSGTAAAAQTSSGGDRKP
ncbi:MAG: ABC transporter substrate-binding protein [Rhodospirillales bacterium]|nr:ABC transporter substrate-binding protein [Rhodospirillales bacterium]